MARTSYANILALPDAALAHNFDLFFPTIPGGGSAAGITYKCKTTAMPSSSLETVKIELHGTSKVEAGRATYTHTFNATFLETVDYATISAFRAWRNYMRSWKSNTGTDSSAYKVNLELDLYDNAGKTVRTVILAGAFITEIAEVTYSGAESAAVELTLSFSFDYINDGASY